jgi:murein DD-endopeptidase MepM/ murein hydrolase activator NlpD
LSFLGLAFVSGYILNEEFGSNESRELERQIESLSREMLQMYDRGADYSNLLHVNIFTDDNYYRLILEMDTIPYPMRNAGRGGSAAYNERAKQANLTYRIGDLITTIDYQLRIQAHSFNALYDKAIEYSAEKSHMPAIQPVSREDLIMIGSEFGIRMDPFISIEKYHYGLDFVTAPGKKVYATGDGVVTFVRYSRTGYGNEIVIDHKFGFATRYGHLGSINLEEGELVKRGQFIGTVGATGRATGPHLHYEVLYRNQPVNPSYYFDTTLTSEEFAQIINRTNGTTN